MAKVNLKINLISEEQTLDFKTTGIRNDNKIVYKENDITVTILVLDNKIEMERVCSDYKINLVFDANNKTISTYQIFGGNKIFDLETITQELKISKNKIELSYILEGNSVKYKLEMEDL